MAEPFYNGTSRPRNDAPTEGGGSGSAVRREPPKATAHGLHLMIVVALVLAGFASLAIWGMGIFFWLAAVVWAIAWAVMAVRGRS